MTEIDIQQTSDQQRNTQERNAHEVKRAPRKGAKKDLQALQEYVFSNPEVIKKTLVDHYEKSIADPAQEYTDTEVINRGKTNQKVKQTECTLKRADFPITFTDKTTTGQTTITFTITFVRLKS